MCKSLKSVGRAFLKVIQDFNTVRTFLYIGCSGPMIRCSCTQSFGLDKRELYAYVAGCPCYIWASTCVLGYVLHFRPTKTQASLCRLASDFVTNIHKVWMKIKTQNKIWTSIVQLDASTVLNWPTQPHLSRWLAPINKFRRVQSSNQIHGQWI